MEEMLVYLKEEIKFYRKQMDNEWGHLTNECKYKNSNNIMPFISNINRYKSRLGLLTEIYKKAITIQVKSNPIPFADKLSWCELWLMRMQDLRNCKYVAEFRRDIDSLIEILNEEIKELEK